MFMRLLSAEAGKTRDTLRSVAWACNAEMSRLLICSGAGPFSISSASNPALKDSSLSRSSASRDAIHWSFSSADGHTQDPKKLRI